MHALWRICCRRCAAVDQALKTRLRRDTKKMGKRWKETRKRRGRIGVDNLWIRNQYAYS